MDVPGIVEEALDGEEVATQVDLGGDDVVFVTPTRTLIYRSEGLLSDESIESSSLDAESLSISEGRRKSRITLEHPIDGTEEFTLPSSAAEETVPAILAGILGTNDVLDEDESVVDTYLFSELTLVISDDRLVKHVGETVWDMEFEEYPFADVTGIYAEQGSVATQLVIEVDGRAERIKTPSDRAREVRETLEDALRLHHGLRPDDDLNDSLAPEEPPSPDGAEEGSEEESTSASTAGGMDFGEGVDPLSAGDTSDTRTNPDPTELERGTVEDAESAEGASQQSEAQGTRSQPTEEAGAPEDEQSAETEAPGAETEQAVAEPAGKPETKSPTEPASDEFQEAGFEPAADRSDELAEEIAELRSAVQKQNKLLTRQHKTIQKLVEELRRGR